MANIGFILLGNEEKENIMVDLNELKNMYYNGRLKGANVFSYLFNLNENSPYDKSNYTIEINLKYLCISSETWYKLYGFLRNGHLCESTNNCFTNVHKDVYEATIKLGGIPSYEDYYEIQKNKQDLIYNPMTPKEDYKKEYIWGVIDRRTSIGNYASYWTEKDYSIAGQFYTDISCYYVRKPL